MSEKIYRWLLRLYPRRFRDDCGDQMRQLFRDRLLSETGLAARLRLWLELLCDLAVSIPREHRRPPQAAPVEIGRYSMSAHAIAGMVWPALLRWASCFAFLIAFGAVLGWLGDAPRLPLIVIYGLLALLGVLPLPGMYSHMDHLRCAEVVLEEDRIEQYDHGRLARTLLRTDVTSLVERKNGGLTIRTTDPRNTIWVPAALPGYEDLRLRLAEWTPIEVLPDRASRSLHGGHAVLLAYALYPAALLVRSPDYAIPLTAIIGVLLFYANLTSRRLALPKSGLLKARLFTLTLTVPLVIKLALVLR